jgi:beta-1,4-mannosyl-glycoprotein beta-1,4-N-acetylglucosaminyltransferase
MCAGSDLIIFSDVDELPNPDTVEQACDVALSGRMAHFAQRLFYYYVNLEEVSGRLLSITGDYPGAKPPQWLGSRMCSMDYAASWTITELRDPGHKATGARVNSGGWHFSYAGSPGPELTVDDRVRQKVLDFAHQELVDDRVMRKLPSRVARQRDVFGRRAKFRRRELDSGFPEYLRVHIDRYSHMVLQ